MLRLAFCDDDPRMLDRLSALVQEYRAAHSTELCVAAFHSAVELLAQIERGVRFDLLFLDVIMPGLNGMDAAREIRQHDSTLRIIFLTSSADFAVESYGVGAYFYLLKPVQPTHLFRLLDTVTAETAKEQQSGGLVLRCKTGITRIALERLEVCEVSGRTLVFHLAGGARQESTGSMDELEHQLAADPRFLRPHRSYLVNMEFIQSISYRTITLTDGVEIPLPHGRYAAVKERYLDYAFRKKQVFL